MKKAYLIFLKFLFSILDFINSIIGNKVLLRHKFKIGILIFVLKSYNTEAQIDLVKGTCYRIGPRFTEGYDFILQSRPSLNEISDNTIKINVGFQRRWISGGIASSYHTKGNAFDVGPYIRFFPIEKRYCFKQYIAVNYQFEITNNLYNELNISSGIIFWHIRPINFELGVDYTYANTSSKTYNVFRPMVGVHYNIRYKKKNQKNTDAE